MRAERADAADLARAGAGGDPDLVNRALTSEAQEALVHDTKHAYANGIFGVPTFVFNNEVFFGNDRLDMLGWRLDQTARA